MSEKVFVIILNYNRPEDTLQCLRTLMNSRPPSSTEYIVVDNSSNTKIKTKLNSLYPKVNYIKSPKNLGFAGGNNLGIKKALSEGATHVLIINPDVIVEEQTINKLLKTHREKSDAGIVAPIHIHKEKGKKASLYSYGGKINWKIATFTHENSSSNTLNDAKSYDFVTFACVLISKETFEKVGLLDDYYFLYIEDVDYCVQASKAGLKSYINPEAVVTHYTSSSFDIPTQKLKYSFPSHIKFIFKWYKFPGYIIPLLYNLYFYAYTYLLWTYQNIKKSIYSKQK